MQHRLTQMVSGYFRIFARGLLKFAVGCVAPDNLQERPTI
jgi:hypothetical protein